MLVERYLKYRLKFVEVEHLLEGSSRLACMPKGILRAPAQLFKAFVHEIIEASFGKASIFSPPPWRNACQQKQSLFNAPYRIDKKLLFLHGMDDIGRKQQLIRIVMGDDNAL